MPRTKGGKKSKSKLKITLVKSIIGENIKVKRTIKALGIKKTYHSVIKEDKPEIVGMIKRAAHILKVEEIKDENQ
ncbi:MAG: 50S ribosomal protein L30 [bacterium]